MRRDQQFNEEEGWMFTPATLLQKGRRKSLLRRLEWRRGLTAQPSIQTSPEHHSPLGHELSREQWGRSRLGQTQSHRCWDWMCACGFDPHFTAKSGCMSQPSLFVCIHENLFTGGSTWGFHMAKEMKNSGSKSHKPHSCFNTIFQHWRGPGKTPTEAKQNRIKKKMSETETPSSSKN